MRKINYIKRWSKDGTVYSQTVYITQGEYKKIIRTLKNSNGYYVDQCYGDYKYMLKRVLEKEGKVIFPNLITADFISKLLNIEIKKDRNVCFCIA